MIHFSRCVGASLIVLMVMVVLINGAPLVQDNAKVFEGTLLSADATARLITLKAGDQEMQFSYTEQTEVVGPQKDGQPVAVKQGSRLKVYYLEADKGRVATKIEVTEP
jgi:hypothetical protein